MTQEAIVVEAHSSDDDDEQGGFDDVLNPDKDIEEELGFHNFDFYTDDGNLVKTTKKEARIERQKQLMKEKWDFPDKIGSFNNYSKP